MTRKISLASANPSANDFEQYSIKEFRIRLTQIIHQVMQKKTRIEVTNHRRVAGYFVPEEDLLRWLTLEPRKKENMRHKPDMPTGMVIISRIKQI